MPLKITITKQLKLENIPANLHNELCDRLKFVNPKWLENKRMGRWNRGTPRELKFYDRARGGRLYIPRGYMGQLISLCRGLGIGFSIEDQRRDLPEVDFRFTGTLKPFQERAVQEMLKKEFGTLSAATGSGKTVMALYMITIRRQPALIVVHTKDLAFQWIDRIGTFLGLPEADVGLIGAGRHRIGEKITVALVQSLYKCADRVSENIGYLVVDECHRTPSRTFTDAVSEFDSRFMLGLSATPYRRDGLSKLIFWHLGDVQHRVGLKKLVQRGDVLAVEVVFRETDFEPFFDPTQEYSKMLTELVSDDKRNHLIAGDVAREVNKGRGLCLVLSDRKSHCSTLQSILRFKHKLSVEVLTGDVAEDQRQEILRRLGEGTSRVLVATGQLVGEGFDFADLTTLFLATPIRFSGRVLQYLGRVLRPAPGKVRAKVYDYVDVHVGPLVSAANSRRRVYGVK